MRRRHTATADTWAASGPSLEALEARILLSGDVLAKFVRGRLTLTGDQWDNNIRIAQVAAAVDAEGGAAVRVSSGDGTTTINGELAVEFAGITAKGFRRKLGRGRTFMSKLSV